MCRRSAPSGPLLAGLESGMDTGIDVYHTDRQELKVEDHLIWAQALASDSVTVHTQ